MASHKESTQPTTKPDAIDLAWGIAPPPDAQAEVRIHAAKMRVAVVLSRLVACYAEICEAGEALSSEIEPQFLGSAEQLDAFIPGGGEVGFRNPGSSGRANFESRLRDTILEIAGGDSGSDGLLEIMRKAQEAMELTHFHVVREVEGAMAGLSEEDFQTLVDAAERNGWPVLDPCAYRVDTAG